MKGLLSGAAVGALLVAAALSWPQGSAAEQLAATAIADANTTSAMPPPHRHTRTPHHAMTHGAARGHVAARSSGNTTANQLNQQELSRLQSGGSTPLPAPAPAPARATPSQGPRPSSGR